jgi:large subunit ribosomal protein L4
MKMDVKTLDGKAAGSIELKDDVFGVEIRSDILSRVVNWQLENRRAPVRGSQDRGDVARTHKKMYKQKGTGGARHGDKRAGLFRGGAKAHGPDYREFSVSLNKKIRALGLKTALSSKARAGKLVVLDTIAMGEGKTKNLLANFKALGLGKALVVDGDTVDANFKRACQNVHTINVLPAIGANVYDILRHDTLVLTKAAVEKLEARFQPKGA